MKQLAQTTIQDRKGQNNPLNPHRARLVSRGQVSFRIPKITMRPVKRGKRSRAWEGFGHEELTDDFVLFLSGFWFNGFSHGRACLFRGLFVCIVSHSRTLISLYTGGFTHQTELNRKERRQARLNEKEQFWFQFHPSDPSHSLSLFLNSTLEQQHWLKWHSSTMLKRRNPSKAD